MDELRVLHVTESMGGGIVTFLASIAGHQAERGATVSVLYAVRPDTPARADIESRLGNGVRVLTPVSGRSSVARALGLGRRLRELARAGEFDVIHLHSSIAGFVGRVSLLAAASRPLVLYSPHGFAFLREDKGRLNRVATRVAEASLARTAPLILTSASEQELAEARLRAPRTALLQSGVPSGSIPVNREYREPTRPRVIMLGRVTYQKAPWRFAHIARALGDEASFVWVGAASPTERKRWFEGFPVTVLDWVPSDRLDSLLDESDVFLFPTLWEGMSLSLIHAQSRGLPSVTSNVVGNRDTVVHGVTGFICTSDEELISATQKLIRDPDLRRSMGVAAQQHARVALVDDRIGVDSLELYRRWGAVRANDSRGRRARRLDKI